MDFIRFSCFVGIIFSIFLITKAQDYYAPYIGERYDTFDWKLVKSLETPSTGNAIISPISVKLVLAMLYEASTGSTEKELQEVLSLPVSRHATRDRFLQIIRSLNLSSVEYTLDIGSRIFLDYHYKAHPRYENILKNYYESQVTSVDFTKLGETKYQINNWANNITQGHVKQLVTDSGLKNAIMVLANALYFKGLWKVPFNTSRTSLATFYLSPEKTSTSPFMIVEENFYYSDFEELDIKFIRVPFKGNISMFIILPNKIDGLPTVIKSLNPEILNELRWSLSFKTVILRLPKFSFEYTTKLKEILYTLGLKEIFEDIASLPGIKSGDKDITNVRVSNFIQKAGIEVNEEGSTAWATTEFDVGTRFGENKIFDADRPFLFYLEDEFTGNVLFVGKVENPALESGKVNTPIRENAQALSNGTTLSQKS